MKRAPVARGGQGAGITQPRDHSLAVPRLYVAVHSRVSPYFRAGRFPRVISLFGLENREGKSHSVRRVWPPKAVAQTDRRDGRTPAAGTLPSAAVGGGRRLRNIREVEQGTQRGGVSCKHWGRRERRRRTARTGTGRTIGRSVIARSVRKNVLRSLKVEFVDRRRRREA